MIGLKPAWWKKITLKRKDWTTRNFFSLVVKFISIHLMLAIITHLNFELYQMDVKTVFFNGKLDEEIYMDQPEGYMVKR